MFSYICVEAEKFDFILGIFLLKVAWKAGFVAVEHF